MGIRMDSSKILTRRPLDTTSECSKFVCTNLGAVGNCHYDVCNKRSSVREVSQKFSVLTEVLSIGSNVFRDKDLDFSSRVMR